MVESGFDNAKLVEMLAEACDEVKGVEKKGVNQEQRYKYQKAADVAMAIRHELFSRGIVILQDEMPPEFHPFETKSGSKQLECRIGITYRIMGHGGCLNVVGYGVGRDSGDKAIWKAKTGAVKYFLRGLGLIPDEKEDPEFDGEEESTGRRSKGEMSAPAEQDESFDISGIVEDEAHNEKRQEIWYKIRLKDGESCYVVSPIATSTGRMQDQLGHLVDLRVEPHPDSKGKAIYLLRDVRKISKAPSDLTPALEKSLEQAKAKKAPVQPSGEPEGVILPPKASTSPETAPTPRNEPSGDETDLIWQTLTVKDAEKRVKRSTKGSKSYWLLTCDIGGADSLAVFVWDTALHEYVAGSKDKECSFGMKRTEKDDSFFYSLQQIDYIGSQLFIDGKPSVAPKGSDLFE